MAMHAANAHPAAAFRSENRVSLAAAKIDDRPLLAQRTQFVCILHEPDRRELLRRERDNEIHTVHLWPRGNSRASLLDFTRFWHPDC